MLRKEVREWVKYLISERKSFKVIFANGQVEVVEYRGYCWVIGMKGYSDDELVEKMVRFQNNEKKFIIRFEAIEEVEEAEEIEASQEAQEVEEVENLTDDLFQEENIAYCEEAIERESNEKVKIYIDQEVFEETGYNETEIKTQIVRQLLQQPDSNLIPNVYKIITLQNGERVEIFPFFIIKNQLIINVKYW